MALSENEVRYIAHLARLGIEENTFSDYTHDLSNILELAAQMQAIPTEDIEPMAHPLNLSQKLRPDIITETDLRDKFQAIAPLVAHGLYLVPKVIEEA